MRDKTWSLYVLECQDGSYYTGIALDPEKRFEAHRKGRGAAYTRAHEPKEILVVELVGTHADALRRERQVKRLSKEAKRKFVASPASFPPPKAKPPRDC